MFGIGPAELIIVLVIALIVLGPKRLPEAGKALGKGMREFKDSVNSVDPREALDEGPEDDGGTERRSAARAFGDEAP